jgi:hypothetical protein
MRKLEHAQRVIAALIGLGWAVGVLLRAFHDPDPRVHNLAIVVFRVGVCVLILSTLLKRVFGKRMDPMVWAFLAFLCVDGMSRGGSFLRFASSVILFALSFVGYGIERRLQRAVQPGVEPAGPPARGLTP